MGIELDGSTHDNIETYEKDRERENFIKNQGIKIIHFQNKDILNNLNGVMESLKQDLNK